MNKKLFIIIAIIVAVALVGFWWWLGRQSAVEAPLGTSDISQDLEGLDVNNLDTEFKQIDQELNNL